MTSSNSPHAQIAEAPARSDFRPRGRPSEADVALPCTRPAALGRTIEAEVIPRLMLALRSASAEIVSARDTYVPSDRDVGEAVRLVIESDAAATLAFVGVLRARGANLQSIYLDLLTPAARQLGTLWEQDRCDFTAVTAGLGRLHQVLHACSPGHSQLEVDDSLCGTRALLLPVPGEQHTFGVLMVSDFLRRTGLDLWTPEVPTEEALGQLVDRNSFALVAFSLSAERHLDRLRSCIARVRKAAASADAQILVGGRLFAKKPALAEEVGADATATDGLEAATLARQLVARTA